MDSAAVTKKNLLREIGKNVILCLCSLVVALLVVETVLRFYNPLGFRIKGNRIILPVNRTQIIHNKKDGKLDALIVNKKNSLGFRGPEPPGDLAGRLTIVTVGGSTTECLALNEEKSWPYLLGKKLENHFPKIWLNNAGLGGHSTFGHAVLMQDFLIRIKPKSVLFLVGLNDIGLVDPNNSDHYLKSIGFKNFEKALVTAASHSEAASALLNLYRFYFPAYIKFADINELDIRSLAHKEIPPDKEAEIIDNHRKKCLQYYRQRLERLANLARENQIDPVLITQPVLYGDVVDDITGVRLDDIDVYDTTSGKVGWRELELYNDITRQVGKDQSLLVIDLARELPKSSLYYYDLVHYSNEGCERVAEILYSDLVPYFVKKYPNHYQAINSTQENCRIGVEQNE